MTMEFYYKAWKAVENNNYNTCKLIISLLMMIQRF